MDASTQPSHIAEADEARLEVQSLGDRPGRFQLLSDPFLYVSHKPIILCTMLTLLKYTIKVMAMCVSLSCSYLTAVWKWCY